MKKRYRHLSKPGIPPGMLLVVLFIALVAVGSPSVIVHNPLTLIPVLIGIGFLAIIAAVVFLWQMEQKRRAKLRALQLADIDHMTGVEFEQYVEGHSCSLTATTCAIRAPQGIMALIC